MLLACTRDGKKLPVFVIFKGTADGRIAREYARTLPNGAVVVTQQNAWVDGNTFLAWVQRVYGPYVAGKPRSLLIMDQCTVHMRTDCITALQVAKTQVRICTCMCIVNLRELVDTYYFLVQYFRVVLRWNLFRKVTRRRCRFVTWG